MTQQIAVPVAAHYESSMARHGFPAVVSVMIAAEVGGLWQMCNCGFGRELMMPYRSCFVEGFGRQLLLFSRGQGLAMLTLQGSVADTKAELGFESPCNHIFPVQKESERAPQEMAFRYATR